MTDSKKEPGSPLWEASLVLSQLAQSYRASLVAPSVANNSFELTIFVSLYNEESCILNTLKTVTASMNEIQKSYEVIVIDDCSTDRSPDLVRSFIEEHPDLNIILIINKTNRGLARNFFDGARIGHGEWYRLVCGDDVEPLETLVTIFKHIGAAEMVVPYQIECPGKTFLRIFLSRTFTTAVNLISGHNLRYYNGLAIHRRSNVLRWPISCRGLSFQADLLTRLLDEGVSFVEVPVKTHERHFGKSTALSFKNLRSVCHTLLDILIRRLRKIFLFSRQSSRSNSSCQIHTQERRTHELYNKK